MGRLLKILCLSTAALVLIGIVLGAVIYFFADSILNSEWSRTKIASALQGHVTYKQGEISYSPYPSLILHNISMRYSKFEIDVDEVLIDPELIALFKGDFKINRIRAYRPNIVITLPKKDEKPFDPRNIEGDLVPIIRGIQSVVPELRFDIRKGSLNLINFAVTPQTPKGLAGFRDIDMQLSFAQDLRIDVQCGFSPWGAMSLNGRLGYRPGKFNIEDLKGFVGRNSISELSAYFDWTRFPEEGLLLKAKTGKSSLVLDDIQRNFNLSVSDIIPHVKKLRGTVRLSSGTFDGPLKSAGKWQYAASGLLDGILVETVPGPAPLHIASATFQVDNKGLAFKNADVSTLDSSLKASGIWQIQEMALNNILFAGKIGPKIISWFSNYYPDLKGAVPPDKIALSGNLKLRPGALEIKNLDLATGKSSITKLAARLDWTKKIYCTIDTAKVVVVPEEFGSWGERFSKQVIPELTSVKGRFTFTPLHFDGYFENSAGWNYKASGNIEKAVAVMDFLPGPVSVATAGFDVNNDRLDIRNARMQLLDSNVTGSGAFYVKGNKKGSTDVRFSGAMGEKATKWTSGLFKVPEHVVIPQTLSITSGHFTWSDSNRYMLQGTFAAQNGLVLSFTWNQTPTAIEIRNASLKDDLSNALFSLDYSKQDVAEFTFSGKLYKKTFDALYRIDQPEDAFLSGDLRGRISLKDLRGTNATGTLQAKDIRIPFGPQNPALFIHSLSIDGNQKELKIKSADLSWKNQRAVVQGIAKTTPDKIILDADLRTTRLIYEELLGTKPGAEVKTGEKKFAWLSRLPIEGDLRIKADQFIFRGVLFEPCAAEITLESDRLRVFVTKALYCNLPLSGTVEIRPDALSFTFRSTLTGLDAAPTLKCLTGEKAGITGVIDYRTEFEGDPNLPTSLRGDGEMTMRNGRFYRAPLLSRILEVLNITQIVMGDIPDFSKGMAYDSFRIRYRIEGEKIIMSWIQLEGNTLRIAGEGSIDTVRRTINLTLLVSPLRTIDKILGKIPIVKNLRNIIAIPVSVSGDINNPTVVPLSPTAIGSNLYNIMKGILQLPFKLLEPLK